MPGEEFEDVLRFWFPEHLRDDHAVMVSQFEWWFRGGADSAIVERFSGTAGASCARKARPLVAQATIPGSRSSPSSTSSPIDSSGHGTGVRAGSEGSRSGPSRHRDRPLRGPRDAVGKDFLLSTFGAPPRSSGTWRRQLSLRRNSWDRRHPSYVGSWSTRRRRPEGIETSLPVSGAILIATRPWGGNQRRRSSTTWPMVNSFIRVRCRTEFSSERRSPLSATYQS